MSTITSALRAQDAHAFIRSRSLPPCGGDLVGAELEWFTVPAENPDRHADFARVRAHLVPCAPRLDGRLTFEPGGQVEVSSRPVAALADLVERLASDVATLRVALDADGVTLEGRALDAGRPSRRVLTTPRYEAMERYWGSEAGRRMMCSTAALQVNVGLGPDPAGRFALAQAVGPVLAAAFAASPLIDGQPSGWKSARLATWAQLDATRTAPVEVAAGTDADAAWSDYALNARVMLVRHPDGSFEAVDDGMTFNEWMAHGDPSIDDLSYHLTTLFPPVRPRGWFELRMIDMLPAPWWPVPVAVAATILRDPVAGDASRHACAGLGAQWQRAAWCGLSDPALAAAAEQCFDAVLATMRTTEPGALTDLVEAYADRYVRAGRTPADDILEGAFI